MITGYYIRIVPGLTGPSWMVSYFKPDGHFEDVAQFYLKQDAAEYVQWKNGGPTENDNQGV